MARDTDPSDKIAVVVLVNNNHMDMTDLRDMMRAMDLYIWEWNPTPMIVFHEGDLQEHDQALVRSFTWRRSITFAYVNWTVFPHGFDPDTHEMKFKWSIGRSKWGYNQMIRFWMTRIWEQPVLEDYTVLVRLDVDSCLTKPFFGFYMPKTANYLSWRASYECGYYQVDEHEFAETYVEKNNITVANPLEWERRHAIDHCVPSFYNNFEVLRIKFFQRPDVAKFQRTICDTEPFGVFTWRWGDAALRWITLALYSPPGTVVVDTNYRFFYSHRCEMHLFEIFALVFALFFLLFLMLLPVSERWRAKILEVAHKIMGSIGIIVRRSPSAPEKSTGSWRKGVGPETETIDLRTLN